MSDLFQPEIVNDLRAQERVRAWIAALRSGEYPQGRSYLRVLDGFCCLGVACNQFNDHIWRQSSAAGASWSYFGAITDLPKPVMDAYRLRRPDGLYMRDDGSTASLAGDNDAGKSFVEIADLIERELEAALAAVREVRR
jgi:hypothetical protein